MRIACLITVCAVLSTTLHITETVNSERRKRPKGHPVQSKSENATSKKEMKSTTIAPSQKVQSVQVGASKKVRRIQQNSSSLEHQCDLTRPKRERRKRQLQRFNTRTLHLGRSYDINENQIETIQMPETFNEGAIHIEPIYRVSKKKNIFDSIVDIVHRVIDPPKTQLGPLVGPVSFPGIGDKVYIRLLEPVHSKHLVIRLITELPTSETESSVNQNILPVHDHADIPLTDHHSVLSTDTIASSSNSNNIVRDLKSSPTVMNQVLQNSLKEATYNSRAFSVNSKDSDLRRIPGVHPLNRSRKRFHGKHGFYRAPRLQNRNRQPVSSINSDHMSMSSTFIENRNRENQLPRVRYQDSSFYLHPSNHHRVNMNSYSESSIESTTKIPDIEAEASLNPVYVSNADSSNLRQVTRNSRVVPVNDFVPKIYSKSSEALHVVKAPILFSPSIRDRYEDYSFEASEKINATNTKIRHVNLNGAVETSISNATNERVDNKDRNSMKSSTIEKVPISANQYFESTKRRSLPIKEIDKSSVERHQNNTGAKNNHRSLETSTKLTNKTRSVTLPKRRLTNFTLNNASKKEVTNFTQSTFSNKDVTNFTPSTISIRNVTNFISNKNVSNVSQNRYTNKNVSNVSQNRHTNKNATNFNSSRHSIKDVTNFDSYNVSRSTTRGQGKKDSKCTKCPKSEENKTHKNDNYESIEEPTFDYYYEDESDLNSTEITTHATIPKPAKSALNIRPVKPTLQSLNLKRQIESLKKSSSKSRTI